MPEDVESNVPCYILHSIKSWWVILAEPLATHQMTAHLLLLGTRMTINFQ